MTHTAKCEYSTSSSARCKCSCGGEEHGKGSQQHSADLEARAKSYDTDADVLEAEEGRSSAARARRERAASLRTDASQIDSRRAEYEETESAASTQSVAVTPYGTGETQDQAVARAHVELGAGSGRVAYAERDPRTGAVTVETADAGPRQTVIVGQDGTTMSSETGNLSMAPPHQAAEK